MRFLSLSFLIGTVPTAVIAAVITLSGDGSASNPSKHDCVSFAEASKHVGATQCVSGTVLHVEEGSSGVTFLNFCPAPRACPFTVVVFPDDRRKVGDLRQLEGRQIEINGTIQDYDGRAQIILRHTKQLGESAFVVVPPVPTDYDVERRGHYSAGRYSHPKAKKTKNKKQGPPISIEDPEEPH
jgi:DNA/RNA endonuclease YhcR with UshA esterase domain